MSKITNSRTPHRGVFRSRLEGYQSKERLVDQKFNGKNTAQDKSAMNALIDKKTTTSNTRKLKKPVNEKLVEIKPVLLNDLKQNRRDEISVKVSPKNKSKATLKKKKSLKALDIPEAIEMPKKVQGAGQKKPAQKRAPPALNQAPPTLKQAQAPPSKLAIIAESPVEPDKKSRQNRSVKAASPSPVAKKAAALLTEDAFMGKKERVSRKERQFSSTAKIRLRRIGDVSENGHSQRHSSNFRQLNLQGPSQIAFETYQGNYLVSSKSQMKTHRVTFQSKIDDDLKYSPGQLNYGDDDEKTSDNSPLKLVSRRRLAQKKSMSPRRDQQALRISQDVEIKKDNFINMFNSEENEQMINNREFKTPMKNTEHLNLTSAKQTRTTEVSRRKRHNTMINPLDADLEIDDRVKTSARRRRADRLVA